MKTQHHFMQKKCYKISASTIHSSIQQISGVSTLFAFFVTLKDKGAVVDPNSFPWLEVWSIKVAVSFVRALHGDCRLSFEDHPDFITIFLFHFFIFLFLPPKHSQPDLSHRFAIFFKQPVPHTFFPLIDSYTAPILIIKQSRAQRCFSTLDQIFKSGSQIESTLFFNRVHFGSTRPLLWKFVWRMRDPGHLFSWFVQGMFEHRSERFWVGSFSDKSIDIFSQETFVFQLDFHWNNKFITFNRTFDQRVCSLIDQIGRIALVIVDNYNFMKKKAQQKKDIVAIFEPGFYWEYQAHPQEVADKVDAFLTTFANQLKALITQDQSLEENYQTLCQKIGYNVHPCLGVKPKEVTQFPALHSNDYGQKFAIFLNHKIDLVTLKLFGFLMQNYKLNCIKFSNNNIEHEAEQIKKIIERQDQLTTLYFQWNRLIDHPKRQQIFLTCARPSLQHLILRQCYLGDQIARDLIKKIKEAPESKLKSLDLYGNDLTPAIIEDISVFVEESKALQFLGLSKNSFSSEESINRLFASIGEIALSQQEYEQHKLKEKARDEVIEKNKKRKKGAPQQPVPFVFEVKQTANGRCYVKNTSLKVLNLASNGLKDSCAGPIRKFIDNNGKGLQLFLQGNKFSKTTKQTFKFYENVIV